MWIQPINSESLGRNKLKTRNQIGIPWVSVNIGIGKLLAPARVYRCHPHSGNRYRGKGIAAGKSAPPQEEVTDNQTLQALRFFREGL